MSDRTNSIPTRIEVHWRRFSSGLWRVPEGDVSAAYCADTFPKVKVFTHEGRLYTNCGSCYSMWVHTQVDAYPLIPVDEYTGPEPRHFSYEGREAKYGGRVFRLGPKMVFVASDPSVEEWRRLARVLYADGGKCASECTYHQFLAERFDPESENGRAARMKEIAEWNERRMPETQEEMRNLLNGREIIHSEQLDLTLAT
jgi:hypothetical protein